MLVAGIVMMSLLIWRTARALAGLETAREQAVLEELTERERAEAARVQLAAIVESSEDAIYTYDFAGTILSWNHSAEKLYGWRAEEIIRRPINTLLPPERATEPRDRIIPAIQRGEIVTNLETLRMRRNGTVFEALLTASPVRDGSGRATALSIIVRDITDRKRLEERYRGLFTSMQEGLLVAELSEASSDGRIDFRYLDMNPAAERILGMSRRQVIGRTVREIIPNAGEDLLKMYEQVARTGVPVHHEVFEPLVSQYHENFAFRPAQGEVAVLFRDITEQKQTAEALRQTTEQLRIVTEGMAVPVTRCSRDLKYVWVSQSCADWIGRPGEEIVSQSIIDIIGPVAFEQLHPYFERVLAGEVVHYEEQVYFRGPGHRWITATYTPTMDAQGTCDGWVAVVIDIDERKRMEEALRESEERFRMASDAAAALVYDIDLTGGRRVIVHGLARVTGYQPDEAELTSEWWHSLIHPEDLPAHLETLTRQLETGGSYISDYRLRRRDGLWIWVEDTAQVLRDDKGAASQLVGAIVDITRRKHAEAEREFLLAQERELRAKAEAATRARDEFLSIVSHELRNPLNSILGYSRLVRTNPENASQVARFAEIIERSARMQQQLIEDLLETARIVSGKLKIETVSTELRRVLKEALSVVQPAAARQIELAARFCDEPLEVIGDAARLQQIAWNLLQNAIKFTPEGGRVELRLERDGEQACIIVSDTGRGIEPEFLPHVFDRFSQSDMSRTRRHGGLGLGLALVRELVELHGGTVEASSAGAGQGATFTVALPLRVSQVVASQLRVRAVAEVSHGPEAIPLENLPRLDGIRVLMVDDQEEARILVAQTLSEWGAAVTTAASGEEALALLAARSFDALVCDIAMPDVDGYEVLRRVRALEYQRSMSHPQQIPAIALTALARAEDRMQALSAGFQMHLAKPVELAELIMVVASVTRNRRQETATME